MNANLSILVVDDDKDILIIMRSLLSSLGASNVQATESGESALKLLENQKFNIILSDYQMEGMSGVDFTERLRNHGDLTPILLISGAPDKAAVLQALQHSRVEFYGKPFEIAALEGAMERLLAA